MQKAKEMTQTKEFTDTLLTAYLDFLGFQIKPKHLGNNRIAFEVSGDNLEEAIQIYYSNPNVPLLHFCSSYKKIRSMIFNMRGAA